MVRTDILVLCDNQAKQNDTETTASHPLMGKPTFMNLFLQYCLNRTNLIDRNAIPGSPMLDSPLATALGSEAQTNGFDIDVSLFSFLLMKLTQSRDTQKYIHSQLLNDAHDESSLLTFMTRACEDVANHSIFAEEVRKVLDKITLYLLIPSDF